MTQPETSPRHYAAILIDGFPWQVTDSGLVFGNQFDEHGNEFRFRAANLGVDPASREKVAASTADLFQMNAQGDVVGNVFPGPSIEGAYPVLWAANQSVPTPLDVPPAVSEAWHFLQIRRTLIPKIPNPQNSDDYIIETKREFDEVHLNRRQGGYVSCIDDDGTVYGYVDNAYATIRYGINRMGDNWLTDVGVLQYYRDWSSALARGNGMTWKGGNSTALGITSGLGPGPYPFGMDLPRFWTFNTGTFELIKTIDTPTGYDEIEVVGLYNKLQYKVIKARSGFTEVGTLSYTNINQPSEETHTIGDVPIGEGSSVKAINREGTALLQDHNGNHLLQWMSSAGPRQITNVAVGVSLNERRVTILGANDEPMTWTSPQIVGAASTNDQVSTGILLEEDLSTRTYEGYDLNTLASMPAGWRITGASDINNSGTIVGYAKNASTGETMGVVLLPVDIVPDWNRDGVIDDRDRGKVTETDPWRFWINDDDDDGTTGGDDIPGKSDSDAKDTGLGYYNVDGVRDLIDFFPLFFDIKQLVEVLPPGTNAVYRLRHEGDAVNVVFTELKPATVGDYLRKSGGASNGLNSATNLANATAKRVNNSGVTIDTAWLQKIKDDGKGVVLVEGRLKSDKPLILELSNGQDQKLTEIKFYISIDNVETMFRHKDLLSVNGGSGGRGDYKVEAGQKPDNYPDKLCSQKNFVFLHGYNVNAQQARGWQAETFKRLWQSGSRARFYGVTWYGSETQERTGGAFTPNYHANVDNAFATAQPLKAFIAALSGETIVAAHSLGNMVVSSTLHDWQGSFSKYFAIDAAMALEAVDGRPEFMNNNMVHLDWDNPAGHGTYPERLWASEWHKLFTDQRGKLTWRNRLEQLTGATVYNFYSSGEEVLDTHPHEVPPTVPDIATDGIGRYAWALQEKLKGRTSTDAVLGSNTGGWGFSSAYDTTRDANGNPTYPLTLPDPAATAQITGAQLRVEPFFRAKTFVSIDLPPELFGANGSQYAQHHRNTLLAQAFPARTLPVGSHEVQRFSDRNFDMNSQAFQNGWPRTDTDWHHSDMREVAFLYTYKLFEKFVELGALKQ